MAITPNLQTATGLSAGGNLTETYLSAVDLLHKFDINPEMMDRYSSFGGPNFLTFFEDMGLAKVTAASTFYNYEKNWLQLGQQIASSSVGTAGTGIAGSVNVVLAAASVDGTPTVRPNDSILFKNNIYGFVTAVTNSSGTWTVAVQPQAGVTATTLNSSISSGDFFGIYSNAQPDGSTPRSSVISKPLMFSNMTQQFRDEFAISGTEMGNKVTVDGPDGKPYWFSVGEMEALLRFRQAVMFGLLLNPASAQQDANGNPIQMTQGLLSLIEQDGINYSLTQGGQFGITDFENIGLALDAEAVRNEINFYVGNELSMQINNSLANSMRNGAIQYNSFGQGDGKQRAIDLGFDSVRLGKRSYHIQTLAAMYHPQITALPGFTSFTSGGFMCPVDKQTDAVSGASINSMELRYKVGADGVDRRYRSTKIDFNITAVDKTTVTHIGELGLGVVGRNRFVRVK